MLRSRKGKGRCVTWRNRQGNPVGSCCNTTTPFRHQCLRLVLGLRNLLMKISTKSLPTSSALPSGQAPLFFVFCFFWRLYYLTYLQPILFYFYFLFQSLVQALIHSYICGGATWPKFSKVALHRIGLRVPHATLSFRIHFRRFSLSLYESSIL